MAYNNSKITFLLITTFVPENWNLLLEIDENVQKVESIGIRAHDLRPCDSMQKNSFHCISYRMEEALFEWNIYLTFEGAKQEFLWKVVKEYSNKNEKPEISDHFMVNKEHILLLTCS